MRTTVSLLVAAVLLATASSASAVDRQIATSCYVGKAWAQRYNPVQYFVTPVGCPTWTFFDFGKNIYVTWMRPVVDVEAADRGAKHWWPGCQHIWYGANDQRASTGTFYTFFHVIC